MFHNLSRREQLAVSAALVAIVAALCYLLLYSPWASRRDRLENQIRARQRQLEEVRLLYGDYQQLQAKAAALDQALARTGRFSLFSFVETVTTRVASRDNLIYIRPQPVLSQNGIREEAVEAKLEKISLEQLVRLLHAVESEQAFLQVRTLRLKTRFDNAEQLDATLAISAFSREQG